MTLEDGVKVASSVDVGLPCATVGDAGGRAVAVGVEVGEVADGTGVRVGVAVMVGLCVAVEEKVAVGVAVPLGVPVCEGVPVAVPVAVLVTVAVGGGLAEKA